MEERTKFITYLSPAKLNLGLKVVGKRPDGYHLINTVFCLIDLFDLVHIQVISNNKISLIDHHKPWQYHTDLAFRAAKLLQEATKCNLGANIKIDKVIPSSAGLGGGSSNAATVLIALNHLWQLNLCNEKLIELGLQLGADVPFFIYGENAYATGIGDKFSAIKIPKWYFVLIKPEFQIATKNIFEALNFKYSSTNSYSPQNLLDSLDNDLQQIAIWLYPELNDIIQDLSNLSKVAMTGSGSVLFLRFENFEDANKVASKLRKRYNSYLVKSMDSSQIHT